jgi:acyl-coenzyme A synthetase/AMP-(fatty) acid ligase
MSDFRKIRVPSFHEIVAANAQERPHVTYAHSIDQEKSLTYGQLYSVSNRIARFYKENGVKRNQRILLLTENSIENMIIFISTLRYGATLATVHVEMNEAYLAEIIRSINPVIVLYQKGLQLERFQVGGTQSWEQLGDWEADGAGTGVFSKISDLSDKDDIKSIAEPDDQGVIFYTSGTVAKPKGVIQTHSTAFHNYDATADYLGLEPGFRTLDCRSYSWLSAQHMSLGAPLVAGSTTIFARHFSQSRYFDWLRAHKINIGFVVPTMINMLINRPHSVTKEDLADLLFLTSSSSPLLEEQWRSFENLYGIRLAQSCGSSEGGNTAAHRGANRKIGSIGPAQKYQKIKIIDSEGNELPRGVAGEIIVGGGLQQAYGYLNPDGTVERLPEDGHHTGDLGFFDSDGHLHITGRVKELIIRGGVNISPVEIDSVLVKHPDIAEAGTFGIPDAIYGEEVVACVTLHDGIKTNPEEIQDFCKSFLIEAKRPKKILIVGELPKNARGKLDRSGLIDLWRNSIKEI